MIFLRGEAEVCLWREAVIARAAAPAASIDDVACRGAMDPDLREMCGRCVMCVADLLVAGYRARLAAPAEPEPAPADVTSCPATKREKRDGAWVTFRCDREAGHSGNHHGGSGVDRRDWA